MEFEDLIATSTGNNIIDEIIFWALESKGAIAAIKGNNTPLGLFDELDPWIPETVDYYTTLEACRLLIEYKSVI